MGRSAVMFFGSVVGLSPIARRLWGGMWGTALWVVTLGWVMGQSPCGAECRQDVGHGPVCGHGSLVCYGAEPHIGAVMGLSPT